MHPGSRVASRQIPSSFVESWNVSRPEICPACPLSCAQLKPIIHRAEMGWGGVARADLARVKSNERTKCPPRSTFSSICPFSRSNPPSITAATVRSYRGPTRVGNNNGHWSSAIPEYSALCSDDSIRQWPIPPDNALVKCTAVGEKGWLQNRGAQRPLTLPPRKSVGEVVPLFNRRDIFVRVPFPERLSSDFRC